MVRQLFTFMYKEIRGLHQAAYILALFTIGSHFLAIVRDRLLAHIFGAGTELDIYYAAFKIPDFLYVLFASVLSVYVLLPFVTRENKADREAPETSVISQMFSLFLITYSLGALILIIFAPFYVPVFFPGFTRNSEILVTLTQILLLQPFFLGLSSLCGVITQLQHRFVLYAISPLLYNLGIILGIVVIYPLIGLPGLALGVVLGALSHLLIQVPFVSKSGYSLAFTKKINWRLIQNILSVAIPRGLTLSLNQIVLLILIGLATTMAAGSVSVFQFAFNLQSVPLAIIGMSYSVAAFPALSRMLTENKLKEFNLELLTALRHIIFWSIPAIALIIVLRAQLVRVLLGSGAFDWGDTRLTAAVLAIFVISLLAQAVLLLLIRAFYAGGKTMIPFIITVLSSALAILSAITFKELYQLNPEWQLLVQDIFRLQEVTGAEVIVLAMAFVVGQFLQMVVLLVMSKKTFNISYRPLWRPFYQAIIAAFVGAYTAYFMLFFIVDGVNQDTFIGISIQGLAAGLSGVFAVFAMYYLLNSSELHEVRTSFKARIFTTDVVKPEPNRL